MIVVSHRFINVVDTYFANLCQCAVTLLLTGTCTVYIKVTKLCTGLQWFTWSGLLIGQRKKSHFAGFSETNSHKNGWFCGKFAVIFGAKLVGKWSVKNGWFHGNFLGMTWPTFLMKKGINFAIVWDNDAITTTATKTMTTAVQYLETYLNVAFLKLAI